MWTNLTESEQKPYQEKFEKDRIRYENQMIQLEKNGYFIKLDGTKSTDVIKVKKYKK